MGKATLASKDFSDASFGNNEKGGIYYNRLRNCSRGLDLTIPSVISHLKRPFKDREQDRDK